MGTGNDPLTDDTARADRVLLRDRLRPRCQPCRLVVHGCRLRRYLDHGADRLRRRADNGRLGLQKCGVWA